MTDFELAAFNIRQEFLENAEHKGCLYHLNASFWRQTVDAGLRTLYINEDNEPHTVRTDIRRLMALPFVPLADLEAAFDEVVEVMDDRVIPVWTYIENTYLRGHRPLRNRRRVPPRFPPQM